MKLDLVLPTSIAPSILILLGLALVVSIIAGLAFWLGPGRAKPAKLDDPDQPQPFGYRMAWLAIKTRETSQVVEALGLEDMRRVNWRSGISTVYDDRVAEQSVFVTTPVAGWTFIVGLALPQPLGGRFTDLVSPLINKLGQQFAEVDYFFSSPDIEHYAWARVIDGKLMRAFAWGDEGVIWNKGRLTKEEKALGINVLDLRALNLSTATLNEFEDATVFPCEDHVIELASAWSVDPTTIDQLDLPPSTGFLATVPSGWRMRRNERPHNNPSPPGVRAHGKPQLRQVV